MDIGKIKELIALLESTDVVDEIMIKEGDTSIRLSRHSNRRTEIGYQPEMHFIPQQIKGHAPATAEEPSKAEKEVQESGHLVRSPMVGTMYLAPSPEAPPFVKVGQPVKVGDTLCIIEAMKMFNEIESDKAGVITKVHVANGDPVEFDEPLFTIE